MLLAGVGNIDSRQRKNYFIVESSNSTHIPIIIIISAETTVTSIEEAFKDLTSRKEVAILLINQHVSINIGI